MNMNHVNTSLEAKVGNETTTPATLVPIQVSSITNSITDYFARLLKKLTAKFEDVIERRANLRFRICEVMVADERLFGLDVMSILKYLKEEAFPCLCKRIAFTNKQKSDYLAVEQAMTIEICSYINYSPKRV